MGLINTIDSYADTIAISFTADRDVMPDPAAYTDGLHKAYEELKAAAVPAARPGKAATPGQTGRIAPAARLTHKIARSAGNRNPFILLMIPGLQGGMTCNAAAAGANRPKGVTYV